MLRKVAVLLLLLLAAGSLFAQTPRIVDVDPILVPAAGGAVVVTTTAVTVWCPGIDLCLVQASLDGNNVPIIAYPKANSYTVLVPAHAPGSTATLTLYGSSSVAASTTLHFATGDDYERVLLPLVPQQRAGANGSLWVVTGSVFNAGADPTDVMGPWNLPSGIAPSLTHPHFPPGDYSTLSLLARTDGGDGALLWAPKFSASSLAFQTRVADTSRSTQTLGAELPVIRESDYRMKVVLLDVPVDARYRSMLRVYGWNDEIEHVRIRIFALTGSEPLVDEVRSTLFHPTKPAVVYPYEPAYLQVPLETWPNILSTSRLRIELTVEQSGLPLWAFVSVTNNETQQVTLVTPQ